MPDNQPAFFQLNTGGEGRPQNNNLRPPPPPPAPFHPGLARPPGDHNGIQFPPVGPPPMTQGNQGMPPHQGPSFPPPPANSVPMDLRSRQKVEIFDTRSERITEADAREQLSSYCIFRLEKASSDHDVDEEGYPVRPTWQKASHIEVTDLSKQQATRKVRELNQFGPPVTDKKNDMSLPIQRQIEFAQGNLERTERDPCYCYILAQLDWQDRKIDVMPAEFVTRTKKGRKTYTEVSRRSKPKRRLERISVTVYFKRTPRPNENVMAMLQDPQRPMLPGLPPMQQGPNMAPMGPMVPMGPPGQQMPHMQMGLPPALPPKMLGPAMKGGMGNKGDGKVKSGKQPNIVVNPAPKGFKMNHGSPRSSKSSMTSDDGWSATDSDIFTPESSVGSSSRYSHRYAKRNRSRGRSRHRDRPEHFGIEAPRHHSKHDHGFAIQHLPLHPAPQPSRPLPDFRRIGDEPFYDDFDNRPRGRPLPAVVQTQPGIRRVPAHEVRREIFADEIERLEDGIERLRMEDDLRREREYERDQEDRFRLQEADLLRGRRLQERLRVGQHDDEPWSPGLERWPDRHARQYMNGREPSLGREMGNPFAPRRPPY